MVGLADGAAICRRSLLTGAALAAGLAVDGRAAAQERSGAFGEGHSIVARDGVAVVETEADRVAGYVREGVFTFKGIPCEQTTGGEPCEIRTKPSLCRHRRY